MTAPHFSLSHSVLDFLVSNEISKGLHQSSVGAVITCQCRTTKVNPWSGRCPHAGQCPPQQSYWTCAQEPVPEARDAAVMRSPLERSRPAHHDRRKLTLNKNSQFFQKKNQISISELLSLLCTLLSSGCHFASRVARKDEMRKSAEKPDFRRS